MGRRTVLRGELTQMDMDDEQTGIWAVAGSTGCVVLAVLVVIIGLLLWWVFTGNLSFFG